MGHKVFFSFHYDDIWYVEQIRNSNAFQKDNEFIGWYDKADREEIKINKENKIKQWIDDQLIGTSVTVVLIGAETSERKYVQYEIEKSCEKNNAIIGVYLQGMKDNNGNLYIKRGESPLRYLRDSFCTTLLYPYQEYDWVRNNGYDNLGEWISSAYADKINPFGFCN